MVPGVLAGFDFAMFKGYRWLVDMDEESVHI